MTNLIQQLSLSNSNYNINYDVDGVEPPAAEERNNDDGASLNADESDRQSPAVSAADAECYSLSLGAGPLWWS